MSTAEYPAVNELTQQCPQLNTQLPMSSPNSVWSWTLNCQWAHQRVSTAEYSAANKLTWQCPQLNTQLSMSSSDGVHRWKLSCPCAHMTGFTAEYSTLNELTQQCPDFKTQLLMNSLESIQSRISSSYALIRPCQQLNTLMSMGLLETVCWWIPNS